jgi:membrane protease subunit (stomatin/prohibitin family)
MGLIKAALGTLSGGINDQFLEFIYCEAIPENILLTKGHKRKSGTSGNTGSDNVISNGSIIAVNTGQCMIIVEQGKIVDVSSEPGEYKYDSATEPSIFTGDLKTSVKDSFKALGKRFAFGGEPPKDQRVYFFNMKEIVGNKYGTSSPVPFRVVDKNIGLDIDISIRCNGEYSYRIVDPILFYTNVAGNVKDVYDRSEIDSMLKTELLTALQPALSKISDLGIRYSALPGHTQEISDALNEVLSAKWASSRGLAVASFGVNSVSTSDENAKMIADLQKSAVMRDPTMAAASLVGAQADAMRAAASNQGGAMTGFMGMGMAQNAGGMNAQTLFGMGQQQQQQPAPAPAPAAAPAAAGWACACGHAGNTGKFCAECGKPQPADAEGWTCGCGAVNKGKFCAQCGAPKPAGALVYKCDKCGWEPADPANPPKFCPECGDLFDDNDKK